MLMIIIQATNITTITIQSANHVIFAATELKNLGGRPPDPHISFPFLSPIKKLATLAHRKISTAFTNQGNNTNSGHFFGYSLSQCWGIDGIQYGGATIAFLGPTHRFLCSHGVYVGDSDVLMF